MLRLPQFGVVMPDDVAGVVEAAGAEVEGLRPGDRVFGSRSGAFAELVSGRNFVPLPAGLSFSEAAALPTAGTTALQAVHAQGGVRAGHHAELRALSISLAQDVAPALCAPRAIHK